MVSKINQKVSIPTQITVGPHTYFVDTSVLTGRSLLDERALGDTFFEELIIRVDKNYPYTVVAETLLHELLHVIWGQTSLMSSLDSITEECVVKAFSPLLLNLLRTNPDVVAYLVANQKDMEGSSE